MPTVEDLYIQVRNHVWVRAAYVDRMPRWIEETLKPYVEELEGMREQYFKAIRGDMKEIMMSNLAKENLELIYDKLKLEETLRDIRDWITNNPNYGEGGLEELEKIIT